MLDVPVTALPYTYRKPNVQLNQGKYTESVGRDVSMGTLRGGRTFIVQWVLKGKRGVFSQEIIRWVLSCLEGAQMTTAEGPGTGYQQL